MTDARTFTKGDRVTFIRVADTYGGLIWITKDLTVYSCGKQQMVLVTDDGERFEGRHFSPTGRHEYTAEVGRAQAELVVHADEDAIAIAHEMGRQYRQDQIAEYRRILERYDGDCDGYRRAMERHLQEAEAIVGTKTEQRETR
jgi:hypothetical protein